MYTVSVEVKESTIDGKGVFAAQNIEKGEVVWRYTEGHDRKMTVNEFNQLDEQTKTSLQRIAYLSPTTGVWVIPPENDPACYTNHDPKDFNTSAVLDDNISEEPIFIANKDIEEGEEITNNYQDFDINSTPEKFSWLAS